MSNNVFEEAPQQGAGATDKVRKAARQLAYDTRYKVKQKFKDGQKADPASLKRAYMQQLGSSSAPGPVKLLAKKMLIGEETYDFIDISDDLKSSSTSVFGKIFVEGGKYVAKEEVEELDEGADTKFTIRVKDKKTGREYYRKADRAKISELRANPNISSVEITGRKESDTYDKTGKKAKKDYDGDGKVESGTAEYMGSRDKAIKKAMAKEEVEELDEIVGAVAGAARVGALAAKGVAKAAPVVAKGVAKGAKAAGKAISKGAKAANKVGKKVDKAVKVADKATDVALKMQELERRDQAEAKDPFADKPYDKYGRSKDPKARRRAQEKAAALRSSDRRSGRNTYGSKMGYAKKEWDE